MAENIAVLDNDDLNTDCLLKIFSYLSVDDMLQVKLVCRKWRQVSQHWFNKIQTLSLDENFFQSGEWKLRENDFIREICSGKSRKKLIAILNTCGGNIKNCYMTDCDDTGVRIDGRRKFAFQLIPKLCKNIVEFRIQPSEDHLPSTFPVMATHWKKLEVLEIRYVPQTIEKDIIKLLRNNQSLKSVSFTFTQELFTYDSDIFFTYLPKTIEEIRINEMAADEDDQFKYFISASKNFTSLRKLTFVCLDYLSNDVMIAISKIKSLRHLTLSKIFSYETDDTVNPIAKLKDLESLDLSNNVELRGSRFIKIVGRLTKLEKLTIIPEALTSKRIAILSKLEHLKIMIINGRNSDCRAIIDICGNLEVFVCNNSNLDNNDVIKLLKKAPKLRWVDVDMNENITREILYAAEKIANERKSLICLGACVMFSHEKGITKKYFRYFQDHRLIPLETFPNYIRNCLEELYTP